MTTGSAGLPETPVTGFSSHMILIWENLETPRCCSAILSASAAISQPAHPSYYNALYISSTNASHISSLRGQKTSITIFSNTYELNERQFICSVFSRAPFWHHLCAGFYALIYPGWKNKKKHSFQYKPFFFFKFCYYFKSTVKARQMVRQPWELTFRYARMWHFNTKTILKE